jgi:predicted  nucleic acid-binding Zn-ribbon protein
MADHDDLVQAKIDIATIQQQIKGITELCSKMDQVIEKLVDQHDRHLAKVYDDIEKKRVEKDMDINELHERIDSVIEKMGNTEKTLLNEIKALRLEMQEHNTKEKESLDKLLEWKWMVAGGILVLSWLISHIKLDTILTGLSR